jgi:hypothetical protein
MKYMRWEQLEVCLRGCIVGIVGCMLLTQFCSLETEPNVHEAAVESILKLLPRVMAPFDAFRGFFESSPRSHYLVDCQELQ